MNSQPDNGGPDGILTFSAADTVLTHDYCSAVTSRNAVVSARINLRSLR